MERIEMAFFNGKTIIKKTVNWSDFDNRDYGILPNLVYFTAWSNDTTDEMTPVRNWLISERELNRKKLAEIIAKVTKEKR